MKFWVDVYATYLWWKAFFLIAFLWPVKWPVELLAPGSRLDMWFHHTLKEQYDVVIAFGKNRFF